MSKKWLKSGLSMKLDLGSSSISFPSLTPALSLIAFQSTGTSETSKTTKKVGIADRHEASGAPFLLIKSQAAVTAFPQADLGHLRAV